MMVQNFRKNFLEKGKSLLYESVLAVRRITPSGLMVTDASDNPASYCGSVCPGVWLVVKMGYLVEENSRQRK